jgi:hypothetical protein
VQVQVHENENEKEHDKVWLISLFSDVAIVFGFINLKTAVAGPKIAHPVKITLAFEFSVLTLTVPGLRAENFKILCAFNQLCHFGPP